MKIIPKYWKVNPFRVDSDIIWATACLMFIFSCYLNHNSGVQKDKEIRQLKAVIAGELKASQKGEALDFKLLPDGIYFSQGFSDLIKIRTDGMYYGTTPSGGSVVRYKHRGSKPKYYAVPENSDIEVIDIPCHDIHRKAIYFTKPGDENTIIYHNYKRAMDDIDRQVIDRIENENIYDATIGVFCAKDSKRGIYRKYLVVQSVG